MILDGLVTTGAKSASAAGTMAAPARTPTEEASPEASSAPTSAASSGIRVSPSSWAAVVPAAVRIVARRMPETVILPACRDGRRGAGWCPALPRRGARARAGLLPATGIFLTVLTNAEEPPPARRTLRKQGAVNRFAQRG